MGQDDEERKKVQLIGAYVTLPFVLAIPPIVGWLIGSWLDKKFGTADYLMYLFLVLGFIAGIREFYRIVKKFGDGV